MKKKELIAVGIGSRIKAIAREKRITIKQLSEITGISVNTLYSIIKRDSARVSSDKIKTIADALRVHPARLLGVSPLHPEECSGEQLSEFDDTTWLFYVESESEEMSKLLLHAFYKLSHEGQEKAIERVQELTEIPKYQAKKEQ